MIILRIHCQNSVLIMTNGLDKEWIFSNKEFLILVSSYLGHCFRIRPRLQQSFPCSRQSINWYHSAWCTICQDSTFYVFIFLVSGKREGEEKHRETPPFIHFLFSQVGCTAMFYFTHGSVYLQETGENCIRTWLFWAPLMLTHRTRFNRKNYYL